MKLSLNKAALLLAAMTFSTTSCAQISDLSTGAKNQSDKPNIIFILTDDQRWDTLGFAGNPIVHTPNMDQLAQQGTYFDNAFVTTPICAASRASIMTGKYERRHGFTFNTPPLATDHIAQSYPALLKEQGYTTGFVGKFGMQYQDNAQEQVFDFFKPMGSDTPAGKFYELNLDTHKHEHLTQRIGDVSSNFIKQQAKSGQPFNLSVSFHAPHADDHDPNQYVYPADLEYLYQDATIPQPDLIEDEYYQRLPQWVKSSISKDRWHWRFDTPVKYQKMVKGYYRMITGVDREIGKIRKQLEVSGLADNTIIILMGDNGYFLGERQIAGKWLMYEHSLRVPLMIYDPKQTAPKRVDQMVLNIDIAPTILSYANLQQPESMQGKALQPLVNGEKVDWRTAFLGEHLMETHWIPKSEGIRTERYKYFRYLDHKNYHELYDLKADPLEKVNLANKPEYQDLLKQMIAQTDKLISDAK